MATSRKNGFTLIEMSIVVVVIGLIIGGIFGGKELIEIARIHRQVSQFQQFQNATHLFKQKYGALPGDISATTAAQIGFTNRSGALGHGDGNNFLESCSAASSILRAGCEVVLFWRDLSSANLIDASFTTATDALLGTLSGTALDAYFPKGKIDGNYMTVFQYGGNNFFTLGAIQSISSSIYINGVGLTPTQAQALSIKLGGLEGTTSGVTIYANQVWAYSSGAAFSTVSVGLTAAQGKCQVATSGAPLVTYNTTPPYSDTLLCNLAVRID